MKFEIQNLAFSYTSTPVLNDISMELNDSEVLGILGPNGSGKTTLMKCMNQVLKPRTGNMLLDGSDFMNIPRREMAKVMGYVPQNNVLDIAFPTVFEVVMMGRRPYGSWVMNSNDVEIVWSALKRMEVDNLANRRFDRLSSGQTQRVLMARAIAQGAKILLLDEPTSNLDIKYQIEVMETVRNLANTDHVGVCAIIHDLDLAAKYCDKVVLLYQGKILAAGTPDEVITPENIKLVYGVDIITNHDYGRLHVVIP